MPRRQSRRQHPRRSDAAQPHGPLERQVASGTVVLQPDEDGRGGWTVFINGIAHSHLAPDDPTRLDFEYMRWAGDLLDVLTEDPQSPLRVAHIGGAGCSLPRYVAATRPGSSQLVFEVDPGIVEVTREAFGMRSTRNLRIRVGDGRQGLDSLPPHSQDVVLRDAFVDATVPHHLRTRQFLETVVRVLAPAGVYVANLADTPPLSRARSEAATALAVFPHVALVAEPAQFKGRRNGNVVLVASAEPLPTTPLARRLACGAVRARLMTPGEVRAFSAGARTYEDE